MHIVADTSASELINAAAGSLHSSALSPHRYRGRLQLCFAPAHNTARTVLTACEQQPPLRVVRAFPLPDGAALVHLHNLSGGVLGGDQLELLIEVEASARAQITSTSATRLYRSRSAAPVAVQRIKCHVAEDALLEYLPDELIPFAGARYFQETTIELATGAGIFWWEIVAPGRAARRELFAYDLLQLKLDLTSAGEVLAQERIKLEPSLRPLSSSVRLGPYRYFATFYLCRVGLSAAPWLALESELAALVRELSRPAEILWGVSTLPAHGLVVRALSVKGHDIKSGLFAFWRAAKLQLYGQTAIPPRKIY